LELNQLHLHSPRCLFHFHREDCHSQAALLLPLPVVLEKDFVVVAMVQMCQVVN
jgi:hypothetical protein